jgi:hypothetical protein
MNPPAPAASLSIAHDIGKIAMAAYTRFAIQLDWSALSPDQAAKLETLRLAVRQVNKDCADIRWSIVPRPRIALAGEADARALLDGYTPSPQADRVIASAFEVFDLIRACSVPADRAPLYNRL